MHDHPLGGQAHGRDQDRQLLLDVHVDRALGQDRVAIRQTCDDQRLVVLGDRDAHQAALAPGRLGHPRPDLVVLVGMTAAEHDQGHVDGLEDRPYGGGGGIRRGVIHIGVRSEEPQTDEIGAEFLDAFACPVGRRVKDVAERLPKMLRPVGGHGIEHFEGHDRAVGARCVAGLKGQRAMSADRDRPAPRPTLGSRGADGRAADPPWPGFMDQLDGHPVHSLCGSGTVGSMSLRVASSASTVTASASRYPSTDASNTTEALGAKSASPAQRM